MIERAGLGMYNQLVRFLAKEISLREFWNWFDASTWNLQETDVGKETLSLAGEIELRLSEFSNGHWTEEELRNKLSPLVRVYVEKEQYWGEPNTWYRTSSSNTIVSPGFTVSRIAEPGSPVDIGFSVEYA